MITHKSIPIIQIKGLFHHYGYQCVFHDFELQIPKQCLTIISGNNGSGKSTLLNILTRISLPQLGQFIWKGIELKTTSAKQNFLQKCAFLSYDSWLFPELSVKENLQFMFSLTHSNNQHNKAYAQEMITKFGLELEMRHHHPLKNLSTGMQKKIALVATLAQKKEYFFFDEPFAHLDKSGSNVLWQQLRYLCNKGKRTLVITMQNPLANTKAGDNIIALDKRD